MGFRKAYFEAIFGLGLGLTVLVWILVFGQLRFIEFAIDPVGI